MSFRAREGDFFLGQPLSALSDRVKGLPILFCAADRTGRSSSPTDPSSPSWGTASMSSAPPLGVHEFFQHIGRYAPQVRSVFVVGGGASATTWPPSWSG